MRVCVNNMVQILYIKNIRLYDTTLRFHQNLHTLFDSNNVFIM